MSTAVQLLDLAGFAPRLEWHQRAACHDADPDIFYPPIVLAKARSSVKVRSAARRGDSLRVTTEAIAAAAVFCDACPVRSECLDWAIHHETEGIWAGTLPFQRAEARRRLGIALVDPSLLDDDPTPDPEDLP